MSQEKTQITPFQPKELDGTASNGDVAIKPFRPKVFGSLAQKDRLPQNSRFDLHPASKKLLGVEEEENAHMEEAVNAAVQIQLASLRDQAHQEGFERGLTEGKAQAEVEFLASVKPLYDQFEALCRVYDSVKSELYAANEQFLVQLIFQFGKQILLKEVASDPEYVKRLSALMIEKIGAKDYVKLKISRQDHANLEQIRDYLKVQFPDLRNIQIEASDDLVLGGCKVETDLSRINAGVETQLKSIEHTLGEP